MEERRRAYLREALRGKAASWALCIGIVFFTIEGASISSWRLIVGGIAVTVLVVFAVAYWSARTRAATDFFAELAPRLGLEYSRYGDYVPMTPLLSAGDRRKYNHAMQGPLHGKLGGPTCLLAHYTYETRHDAGEEVTVWKPHPFTVCAIDVGGPLLRFRGVYLRPRLSGLGLDNDWLNRGPKFDKVELESVRFNELYDLRHGSDQDEIALRELFSPTFVASLTENPLRPGFECKAGTLVVFIRGHEASEGKISMLLDTARSIARRLDEQDTPHFATAERPLVGR
ncbi:MAG TPA: hypothetical protein VF715_05915 [Thermoleophilaceae bacterium]|jgi:hypothetical protein